MTRYRWFDFKTRLSLSDLAGRLRDGPYTDEKGGGFILDQVRSDFIVASYVERVTRIEEVTDPFGRSQRYERTEYDLQRFRVLDHGSTIEMVSPSRSSNTLITRLLEATDFDVTVAPISIDPMDWWSRFSRLMSVQGVLDRVEVRNLLVGEGALAQIKVEGGGDVAEVLRRMVDLEIVTFDKVRVRFPLKSGWALMTANAAVEIKSASEVELLGGLRKSLRASGPDA
ncbi:hypothetical protein J2W42_002755 [Rhizobium tibeticum]|uniref:hypothetical protein n=1 Tax=Rhizobium tibeticum TaxID=501024 RepID=UPI00277FE6ED|nr:hypothetical protein [Rhizobium tibeticum]MDP9809896.1 hypothetical protein [Rhizobium tibeticum]